MLIGGRLYTIYESLENELDRRWMFSNTVIRCSISYTCILLRASSSTNHQVFAVVDIFTKYTLSVRTYAKEYTLNGRNISEGRLLSL